jgi:hypothetical protein
MKTRHFLSIGFFFVLVGYFYSNTTLKTTIVKHDETKLNVYHEIKKVEAVYYHEIGKYSVAVLEGNEVKMLELPNYKHKNINPKVFMDVEEGQKSWFEIKYEQEDTNNTSRKTYFTNTHGDKIKPYIHIHIRDINDLNNGGWNHGKFGSGKTIKISN